MIKFAYEVPEVQVGFTKYIAVTLDIYNSGVTLDGLMQFCEASF